MLKTISACSVPQRAQLLRKCAFTTRQRVPNSRPSPRSRQLRLRITAAAERDATADSPPDPALRDVRHALQKGRRPAACQGAVQLSSPVSIYGQGHSGQPFAVTLPPAEAAALQPLLDACVPNDFGASDEVQQMAAEVYK